MCSMTIDWSEYTDDELLDGERTWASALAAYLKAVITGRNVRGGLLGPEEWLAMRECVELARGRLGDIERERMAREMVVR